MTSVPTLLMKILYIIHLFNHNINKLANINQVIFNIMPKECSDLTILQIPNETTLNVIN